MRAEVAPWVRDVPSDVVSNQTAEIQLTVHRPQGDGRRRDRHHGAPQATGRARRAAGSHGGRAVMNTNAPDLQVSSIFRESDSYYLIGFRPADSTPNGRFYEIKVTTKRRGLNVRARSGYTAASASERRSATSAETTLPAPLRVALTGLLPNSRMLLDVNARIITLHFRSPASRRVSISSGSRPRWAHASPAARCDSA
jgi:hypothetical protein